MEKVGGRHKHGGEEGKEVKEACVVSHVKTQLGVHHHVNTCQLPSDVLEGGKGIKGQNSMHMSLSIIVYGQWKERGESVTERAEWWDSCSRLLGG